MADIKIYNLVNGAYLQPFIFETVQLLIWLNVFIRLLTHRLTTVVVIFHDTRLSFHFRDTGNQHNHRLTNESKACILMASHKSHSATVRGSPFAGFATNKNTKRSTSTATGCVKISKYQSCFQLDFNVSYFALKMRRNNRFMLFAYIHFWHRIWTLFFGWRTVNLISEILSEILILLFTQYL